VVAAGPVRDGIGDLFEGLVPAEVIDAYDRLLARDGCAKDQAEELVGGAGLVQALTDRGMAHVLPRFPGRSGVAAARVTGPGVAGRPGWPSEPSGP
jgi:hypothetical protein